MIHTFWYIQAIFITFRDSRKHLQSLFLYSFWYIFYKNLALFHNFYNNQTFVLICIFLNYSDYHISTLPINYNLHILSNVYALYCKFCVMVYLQQILTNNFCCLFHNYILLFQTFSWAKKRYNIRCFHQHITSYIYK